MARYRCVVGQPLEEQVLALQHADDGPPQRRFSGLARPSRSETGRTTRSYGGCCFRYATSLPISLAWKPASPRSMETVSSPRSFGSTDTPLPAAALMTAGTSQRKSRMAGVLRKSGTRCCEEHADPAEEDVAVADVRLVRPGGGVDGQQRDVVAAGHQLRGYGVVAQAGPAVHPARARRQVEEAHATWGGSPGASRGTLTILREP